MARLIAVDLGADTVAVSVFQGTSGGVRLEAEVTRRVPQDGSVPPRLEDRLAILDTILSEHPDWRKGSHLTALAWPSSRASCHRLQLPFDDDTRIEQTLPFTLEAEVPFDLDGMLIGWRRLGTGPGRVIATLVPEAELEKVLEALAERDLDPRRVYCDGELLARYATGEEVTAVVDVGHDHTTVTVAREGRALAWRSLGVAGRTFTRAVQEAAGLSWPEAELLKHGDAGVPADGPADGDDEDTLTFGAVDDMSAEEGATPEADAVPDRARPVLDGVVALLLAEIRSTLVQAEDDLGVEVTRVLLTGGGARLPELRGWLEQDLGVPVGEVHDEVGGPVRGELAVARALVHSIGGQDDALTDLRIGDLAWKGGISAPQTLITWAAVGSATFLATVFALFVWQFLGLRAEKAEIDDRIRTAVAAVVPDLPEGVDGTSAVALLSDRVLEVRTEAEFLGDASAAPPTVDLLYQITRAFPPHPEVVVNVDALEVTPRAVQIRGVTDGLAQIDSINQGLQASGLFLKVETEPGDKTREGKVEFTVDMTRATDGADDDTDWPEEGG